MESASNLVTKFKYSIIYNNVEYTSIELILEDNSKQIEIFKELSEHGTNSLDSLKIPISNDECIIFSRIQLDESLIKLKIWDEDIITKKVNKLDKTKKNI